MAHSEPITLYTSATPNGFKISITLEELGLSYKTRPVDLQSNEQKEEYDKYKTAGANYTKYIAGGF